MEFAKILKDLEVELGRFHCRPRTLVPDLVLLGLATDVFESAMAVYGTSQSALPHKAYSNARLAFEGAQNLVVLATHEDYERSGARAWVYFELKDASWRATNERKKNILASPLTPDQWFDERIAQMVAIWNSVAQRQGELLVDARAVVLRDRKKRPDNWLHEDMTVRQHRAYTLFAAAKGKKFPAETTELNRAIYQALCRETHARPRLDSFGVLRDDNGMLLVHVLPRNLEKAKYAVIAGTEICVQEAATALRWQRTCSD
jgi:hypothetical protein